MFPAYSVKARNSKLDWLGLNITLVTQSQQQIWYMLLLVVT